MRRSTHALALAAGPALFTIFAFGCSSDDDTTGGASGSGGATAGRVGGGGASASSGGSTAGKDGTSAGNVGRGGASGTAASGGGSGGSTTNGGSGTAGDSVLGGTSGSDTAGEAGAGGGSDGTISCLPGGPACHYVRAGATGNGDGTSWANAWTELPDELARGEVYFVAQGTYPGYDFDDAPSPPEPLTPCCKSIRIVRATRSEHGTNDGWDDAYATGESVFGELDFQTSDYVFEGRGAVRAVGNFRGTVVTITGDRTVFSGVDVDGAFETTGGMHTAGACTGLEISGNVVSVSGNHVHDIADDGVVVGGNHDLLFEGNEIDSLYGCGTDGGCGPCDNGHSDGLEIYAVHDSEFIGNFAHDIASTSTFFFGNWADELGDGPADYCENIFLVNNILYNPDTGFVAYLEDVRGVTLTGNTIWGAHQGRYGGLAIGVNVSGLEIYDNVILSINYEHLGSTFNPAEHHGDYNLFGISLGQWTDSEHDLVALDPGFTAIPDADGAKVSDPMPVDFTPSAESPLRGAGTSDAYWPEWWRNPSDFFGTVRASPPTIGAIE